MPEKSHLDPEEGGKPDTPERLDHGSAGVHQRLRGDREPDQMGELHEREIPAAVHPKDQFRIPRGSEALGNQGERRTWERDEGWMKRKIREEQSHLRASY